MVGFLVFFGCCLFLVVILLVFCLCSGFVFLFLRFLFFETLCTLVGFLVSFGCCLFLVGVLLMFCLCFGLVFLFLRFLFLRLGALWLGSCFFEAVVCFWW